MRTRVYVDGFNLYYGAIKGTQLKWLDPVHLSRLLLPQACTVDKLLYFTAHVSGRIGIANFANFQQLDIVTDDNIVVVGENKVGKSNFVRALQLVLDPGLSELCR